MPTTIPGNLIFQSPTNNDPLLDLNTQPSLDLQFATSKTLDDRVSGLPLVDHQRDVSSGKSAGTYVGSDGLIKTSLVNLLPYSEQFDQSVWNRTSLDISANVAASPTGTFTADQLTVNSGATFAYVRQTKSVDNGSTLTLSISVKYVNCRYVWLLGGANPDVFAYFDLINGTVGPTNGYVCSIADSGNGWYRCSATITKTSASGNEEIGLGLTRTDNNPKNNAVGDSVLIWGAQLEESSTASPYIKTTNLPSAAPRFDHDPVTGESLGLLVEESRTNNFLYSVDLGQPVWTALNATVTNNVLTAPNGLTEAVKLESDGTTAAQRTGHDGITGTITISIFAKTGTARYLQLLHSENAQFYANFDLQTGTKGTFGSASSSTIESYGNGWYRCTLTITTTTAGKCYFYITPSPSSTFGSSYIAQVDSLYLWGAQLEQGSFPTSYIPTSGSTVTRAADVASITGTNFSSWYNQSEGTILESVRTVVPANTSNGFLFKITDGTSNNRIELQQVGSGDSYPRVSGIYRYLNSTTAGFTNQETGWDTDGKTLDNIAFTWNSSGFTLQTKFDSTPSTGTGTYPQNLTQISIDHRGTIARFTYYPYRLGDTTLQEITS